MRIPLFQLDAFTDRRFAGNPAAVMPLPAFFDDATLQAIAAENNLAETAFLVAHGDGYRLRWFTPSVEVPLCGHATLASAAVVMERLAPSRTRVVFDTASGPLTVERRGDGYAMDFPARPSRSRSSRYRSGRPISACATRRAIAPSTMTRAARRVRSRSSSWGPTER